MEFRDKSRLSYYASLFKTVEINSTFRKIPKHSTFAKWSQEVPGDFQFTLKLLKDFTHVINLQTVPRNRGAFINAAEHIGSNKGCLLVQFPASIESHSREGVEKILATLDELDADNHWQKAIEFRSKTWYTSETYAMLARYKGSIVFHDMPKSGSLHIEQPFSFYLFQLS